MPRVPIVGGNWKSNPSSVEEINNLSKELTVKKLGEHAPDAVQIVIAPTFLHTVPQKSALPENVNIAVQNCSKNPEGAFTGEVTAKMVKDVGINWVIIGHSERRHVYKETDEELAEKVKKAMDQGLSVIYCIGELLEERESGKTNDVVKAQMKYLIDANPDWSRIVIAYEPVWAIGTGKVATVDQAQEAHLLTRQLLRESAGDQVADAMRIQYGGSVKAQNCEELIKMPDIDGFLVGGASLKPEFQDIISTVASNK